MDIGALHFQISNGNFAIGSHAIQHAVKEGFTKEDMIYAILNGSVIERYPGRKRCLFCADVIIEGLTMPLHVICEHLHPKSPVDFVTAYIPSEEEWETPTQRRRKKGKV
ncbi:MAG: DUF4258 domain-containing protein [Syntrophales bacterium]|nr:DUF4258 domain-containing protein [Syntrophales bacterium]